MFLDDELYQIGKDANNSKDGILTAMSEMINKTFRTFQKQRNGSNDIRIIIKCFKRVNNSFILASNRLQKEGIKWFEQDLFKCYIEQIPELKSISQLLK